MTVAATAAGVARLLGSNSSPRRDGLEAHLLRHGELPPLDSAGMRRSLVAEIAASGLTGRGGAGFPASRKLSGAAGGPLGTVLVVNAMEGEPASLKDKVLIERAPHLVLDGAEVAAQVVKARRIVICVAAGATATLRSLWRARDERDPLGGASVEFASLHGHFVAGEESALVDALGGGAGLPSFRPDKAVPLQLGRRTAVVHNAETLAQLALIARHGAAWFRSVGDPDAPGTVLVSVGGDVALPGVVEVATGTPVSAILEQARPDAARGVLVGGYGGTWIPPEHLGVPFSPAPLRSLGAAMGAGILVVLGASRCAIEVTARLARYLAEESAGQCGPCVFGLAAIADDLAQLAAGQGGIQARDRLVRRLAVVDGRGACRHPDGAVRMVRSALRVFAAELDQHVRGRSASSCAPAR